MKLHYVPNCEIRMVAFYSLLTQLVCVKKLEMVGILLVVMLVVMMVMVVIRVVMIGKMKGLLA